MLMGLGCNAAAIVGCRIIDSPRERLIAILTNAFVPCNGRFPALIAVISMFFTYSAFASGALAGAVMLTALLIVSVAATLLCGRLLSRTLLKGEQSSFTLELPPYRLPSLHNMLTHVWQKVKGFLVKAGTLILLMSMVLWLLQSFDFSLHMVENEADSMLGALGSVIAPIFKPLGFGFWQAAVALLTGLIAKEMVVSSLSMFYGFALTAPSAQVAAAMTGFTPLSALSMLVFILLYVPCVAAVSTLAKEMNSMKWTLFSIGWQLGVAYVASLLVYQVGSLFL